MSLFNPQFQIVSDLHLETPLHRPSYAQFKLHTFSNNLFLLGDIGLIKDHGLFVFLESLLEATSNLKIFYVLGNHEAYQITLENAIHTMNSFQQKMRRQYGDRFFFLHRTRHDLGPTLTILGCTLWTHIPPSNAAEAQSRLSDMKEDLGIRDRTIEQHNSDHETDLRWLNSEVQRIDDSEPQRQIIVLTHHSPSLDSRAVDPQHQGSTIQSGFATDLSQEVCWISPSVKMWAFGHTHYSCLFRDDATDKLVVANQNGYNVLEKNSQCPSVVVEAAGKRFIPVEIDQPKILKPAQSALPAISAPNSLSRPSLLKRVGKKLLCNFGS
jgi:hypothetical protein